MSAKKLSDNFKTWIELDGRALRRNVETFRKLIGPRVKLWSVVKSNAYGHGLFAFSSLANPLVDGFCVDSVVEGKKLRSEGVTKHILVLGPTLPVLFKDAAEEKITISIADMSSLMSLKRAKARPQFHVKFDTGMHRQGFFSHDLTKIIPILKSMREEFRGIFTHFASAKDVNYQTYTLHQFEDFQKIRARLLGAGFKNIVSHTAATGGAMLDKKYHADAVRVGIGLFGLYPSKELELQLGKEFRLSPVLSWRAVVSEVKNLKKGDYIGYDLVERLAQPTRVAVLPIGYWHGFPRSLSGIGEVLLSGRRARVLGRVSMDLISVDATGIPVLPGSVATLIGMNSTSEISASHLASQAGTIHYEFLTRLNPLIERTVRGGARNAS